jgi:hypothetical protein
MFVFVEDAVEAVALSYAAAGLLVRICDRGGQWVQQRRQERAIARVEPHPAVAELALQHRDLMAQGEELRVLVPIAHREQAQHRPRRSRPLHPSVHPQAGLIDLTVLINHRSTVGRAGQRVPQGRLTIAETQLSENRRVMALRNSGVEMEY